MADFLGNNLQSILNPQVANIQQPLNTLLQGIQQGRAVDRQDQLIADERAIQDQALLSQQNAQKEAAFAASLIGLPDDQRLSVLQQGVQSGGFNQDFIQELGQLSQMPIAQQDTFIANTLTSEGFGELVPKGNMGKVGAIRYVDTGNQIQARDTRTNELLETIDKTTPDGKRRELELRNQEIEIRTDERKSKISEKKQERFEAARSSVDTIDRALSTVNQVIESPGFESAVGASSVLPTIPGTERADFEAILDKFQGQQFLEGVQQMKGLGTLTETEGKKITQAAAALNQNMSEKAFLREVDIIKSTLTRAKGRAGSKLKSLTPKGSSASTDNLSDTELLNKYGI